MDYASRKGAQRAARKQGLESGSFDVVEVNDRHVIVNVVNLSVAGESVKLNGPRHVSASKPVGFVWAFLAVNPDVPRKTQIAALIQMGLNPNMTRTQTSRFYTTGGDKAAYLAIEKTKRDAEAARIQVLVDKLRTKE